MPKEGLDIEERSIERPSRRHFAYELISISCPFIGFGMGLLYLRSTFPPGKVDGIGLAIMSVLLIISVMLGAVCGVLFAVLSLKRRTS